jgi:hypothetical protein
MRIIWLVASVAVAGLAGARSAVACSSSPVPRVYWTLTETVPPPARPLPTDGALLLKARPWSDLPAQQLRNLAPEVEVVVRDDRATVVPGAVEAWPVGENPTIVWRPASPLAPGASFSVEARATSEVPRPAGATGETLLRASFDTGPGLAPPLRLMGDVDAKLETYDQPVFKDCNPCGGGCTPNGTVPALRARITIPPVEGGHAPDGYAVSVWVAQGRPTGAGDAGTRVDQPGADRLASGAATELVRPIVQADESYSPCIIVRVFDSAGHFAEPPPVCLPPTDANGPARSRAGCAIGAVSGADPGGAGLVVGAALTLLIARRRDGRGGQPRRRRGGTTDRGQ